MSGHTLIAGTTECGKTTLAKKLLIPTFKQSGISVIVLDPMSDPGWNADFQTTDPDEFLDVVWNSERCACFIDEAGQSSGAYDRPMHETATKGRHWGHRMHYLCQRPAQVAPVIRNQCTQVFAFLLEEEDAKAVSRSFVNKGLLEATTLLQGEYLYARKFSDDGTIGKTVKGRVF